MIPSSDTLDAKIGQMLMVGFRGCEFRGDLPIVADIRDRHLGGVVLFDYDVQRRTPERNIQRPEQVRRLVASLQDVADVPLFVGIDQEGGRVNRLKEACGFPPTVSAQYLGECDDVDVTRAHAGQIAATLADLGINLNFAPVVDLNTYPNNPVIGNVERSFAADPAAVIRHAGAWIESHHAHGILCAPKHFPGHGSSRQDSHFGFTDVTDTWDAAELQPYAALIRGGFNDMVMTAHIFNAHLDPVFPATLSSRTLTTILREELRFGGVIISDDMQMQAIAARYGLESAIRAAIEAGVDIVLFGNNCAYHDDIMNRVTSILAHLVNSGRLSEDRIERSWQRIARLKARLPTASGASLQSGEHSWPATER